MSRNQNFPMLGVSNLTVRLSWATVEIMVDDVEEIQVLIAGDEADVKELKLDCTAGHLLLEQPALTRTVNLTAGRWMDVFIRMPQAWKGPVELTTRSGRINARGLTGTDIRLETVSGDIRVMNVRGIDCCMHTVSGHLFGALVDCDKLSLRTVNTGVALEDASLRTARAASVNGDIRLALTAPFEAVDVNTVSGALSISAPIHDVRMQYHSVSGQLSTRGVALQQEGAQITFNSVSGDLTITGLMEEP